MWYKIVKSIEVIVKVLLPIDWKWAFSAIKKIWKG